MSWVSHTIFESLLQMFSSSFSICSDLQARERQRGRSSPHLSLLYSIPLSTSAGPGGHCPTELGQALAWSVDSPSHRAAHTHGLAPFLLGSRQQVHLQEPSCLLRAQRGVPEYQTQLYSNVSTKSHFDSNINDPCCPVVLPSLLPPISGDNGAMTLHVLQDQYDEWCIYLSRSEAPHTKGRFSPCHYHRRLPVPRHSKSPCLQGLEKETITDSPGTAST